MVPTVTILVVDDFFDFRRFVSFMLSTCADLQIIGEAGDGQEATRLAEELRPSLILLDINLPVLDGIKAARRIRLVSPDSKILFVSLVESPDLVEEALATGAHGYVFKSRAASELLPAIRAVTTGRKYLSRHTPGPSYH
jgi:DNA-binding NarL/FixJ family response regulator